MNPCGEAILAPYESCDLGSLVIPHFVNNGITDWKKLKETCLGKELEYSYDEEVRKFYIQTSDMGQIGLSLNYNDIKDSLDKYEHVIIKEVDVIHQNIKFDFC